MCTSVELARLTTMNETADLYQAAIQAILIDGVVEYSINTGQTVQRVTKANVENYQKAYNSLLNDIVIWEARCGKRRTGFNMRPSF